MQLILVNSKDLLQILYIYFTNWLGFISRQEQINRLLVVIHHEDRHELASLRFLHLNLESQKVKSRRRTYEHFSFFFSMRLGPKSLSCSRYHSSFYSCRLFFKKDGIIIAIHGRKTLHWQLTKVILSGTYNCNFEATDQVSNRGKKKLEMEYGTFICTIIFYLTLCVRFRKELLMLSLLQELLTFARDFFSYRSLQLRLWFKL